MAKAPSAATAARARRQAQKAETGDTTIELTWKGRKLSISLGQLGPGDDLECRRQTGWPFSGFVSLLRKDGHAGFDVVATVLWMARRKNGEPDLTLEQAFEEAGSIEQLSKDLEMGTAKAAAANGQVLDVGEAQPPE